MQCLENIVSGFYTGNSLKPYSLDDGDSRVAISDRSSANPCMSHGILFWVKVRRLSATIIVSSGVWDPPGKFHCPTFSTPLDPENLPTPIDPHPPGSWKFLNPSPSLEISKIARIARTFPPNLRNPRHCTGLTQFNSHNATSIEL